MGHLVETRHHGSLVHIIVTALQQLVAVAKPPLADIFGGSHTCKGFHLTVEGAVAHGHLIRHEGHVDIILLDTILDKTVQTVDKFLIKMAQLRHHGWPVCICRRQIVGLFIVDNELRKPSTCIQQILNTTGQQFCCERLG